MEKKDKKDNSAAAEFEDTETLLEIVRKARAESSTSSDKFKEQFPDLPYSYPNASYVLNKRGYSVQWAKDGWDKEYEELMDEYYELLKKLQAKEEENQTLKNDLKEKKTEIIWIGQSQKDGPSVYLSFPVSKKIADRWNRMAGALSCKQPLGNAILGKFMDRVENGEIRFLM